jgi:hypothetical protein
VGALRRDSSASDEVTIALFDAAELSPFASVQKLAKVYLANRDWGNIDRVAILSALLRGTGVDRLIGSGRATQAVVTVLQREWESLRTACADRTEVATVLRNFTEVAVPEDYLKATCKPTGPSPALVCSLASSFGADNLPALAKFLGSLDFRRVLKRDQTADPVSGELIR